MSDKVSCAGPDCPRSVEAPPKGMKAYCSITCAIMDGKIDLRGAKM